MCLVHLSDIMGWNNQFTLLAFLGIFSRMHVRLYRLSMLFTFFFRKLINVIVAKNNI